MLVIIFCLLLGTMIALFVPVNIPVDATIYAAVAILAGFDTIFGGLIAHFNNNFKLNVFLSGFFGNAILAAIITYIGTLLNVDLSIAVIVVFGTRLFQNFAILRRFFLEKHLEKNKSKKI